MTAAPRAIVLGIAQDGGHPQPGCERACCRDQIDNHHLTACIAVVDGDQGWLVDAGPDFRLHLDRLEATGAALAGILLTHAHIGHYTGLMFLGREAMDTDMLPVWAAPRLADFLRSNAPWEQLISSSNIDLRTIELAEPIPLSNQLTVHAFPVPHRDEYSETVGYRIEGPRRGLLYVPDTDSWDGWATPIEEHLRGVDVALLDATFFDAAELPNRDISKIAHPLVVESLRRFSALESSELAKIRFTHLNHSNPLLDPASDESVTVARAGLAVAAEGSTFQL